MVKTRNKFKNRSVVLRGRRSVTTKEIYLEAVAQRSPIALLRSLDPLELPSASGEHSSALQDFRYCCKFLKNGTGVCTYDTRHSTYVIRHACDFRDTPKPQKIHTHATLSRLSTDLSATHTLCIVYCSNALHKYSKNCADFDPSNIRIGIFRFRK